MKNCVNCGAQIQDHMKFCQVCGTKQPEPAPQPQFQAPPQQPQYQAPQYQAPPQQPQYQAPQYQAPPQPQYQPQPQTPPAGAHPFGVSDWDGGVLDTFINSLVASLIISVSCGIATPWAVCYMMKYVADHAIIDGKRVVFTGTGGDLFGQYIKWFLLTIVTCGIYSFWVLPKMYKWVVSHLHTVG